MTARKPSVCLITNELYPLGPGGIGRMLYNFARQNERLGFPADIHFLVPQALLTSRPDAREVLEAALDGIATVHVCADLSAVPTPLAQLLARSKEFPWTNEWLYAESYRYYLGLRTAEEKLGAPFDVVEFTDFGGWGAASIEAKRAGLAFADTLIAVRVHSTQGILNGVERFAHTPGFWAGIMFDAERHLYANADLVVGHDPAILAHTARSYALEERWQGRTVLEFPPVYLRTGQGTYLEAEDVVVPPADSKVDFLFGSRLQPVKRPDLFIRAAILFLERNEQYSGTFRLVCSGWDRAYVDRMKELVPDALADRIRFIEQATSDERQYYIGRSIVVVPSDYESLNLFAFEAALAGRKVILNARCPAFGNDFRWHDRRNCLLFDGSVEGLEAAMREALQWRPTEAVEVAASRPYWLDADAHRGGAASVVPAAGVIRIFCFGALSAKEVRQHFDGALDLQTRLEAAGRAVEVTFQLSRGRFGLDGTQAAAVRAQGWALVFSSGLRECPEMFGRRLGAMGDDPILLYPAGFDPAPEFVDAAASVIAADPALTLVGGHIELLDPASGRSDYLRVYAGEAPSTALQSSRIVPGLCFVRPEVIRRHGFDPLATGLWFEVFARRCALAGERIAILPMLAGSLSATLSQRPETTKRISAGLLDELGRVAGWQARLLSIDPFETLGETGDRPFAYGYEQMRRAIRISPPGAIRSWEPVGWQENEHGILVHPLDGVITAAELDGPPRRIMSLTAYVRNVDAENDGALVAIGLVRSGFLPDDLLKAIERDEPSEDLALSDWVEVDAGRSTRIECSCYDVSGGDDKILLLTKLADGAKENNVQTVFTGIDVRFDDHTVA
jgi:glycosyltransferase involved in cell wall biosynthesis